MPPIRRSGSLQNLLIYGLSGPIIALNLWLLSALFRYFQHPVTILSLAAILAFLLNYPVKFFERASRTRSQAVVIVLLATLMVLVILGITLVPIIEQTIELLKQIPDWLATSQGNLVHFEAWAKQQRLSLNLRVINNQINTYLESWVQQLASNAVGFAGTLLSGLLNLLLVVVLAFYMLLYGDRVWHALVSLLPYHIRVPLTASLKLNFRNFFLTQLLLGLFMLLSLTPIFLVLHVPFALVFAILIGLSELIPFLGATIGIGLVTILVLLQSWWLAIQVAIAAVIMQQVKDNLLAPKLMGDFIGLNPIWVFVAILMGFEIAGLLGTIVAVPIAGTIKGTFDAINRAKSEPSVLSVTSNGS